MRNEKQNKPFHLTAIPPALHSGMLVSVLNRSSASEADGSSKIQDG